VLGLKAQHHAKQQYYNGDAAQYEDYVLDGPRYGEVKVFVEDDYEQENNDGINERPNPGLRHEPLGILINE
jgi:hypothetical protein